MVLFTMVFFLSCASPEEKALRQAQKLVYEGKVKESLGFLEESTRRFPEYLPLRYLYGWSLLGIGQQGAALGQFSLCLNKDPNYYGGHKGMAELFLYQKKLALAQEEFQKAIALKPDLPEIYSALAQVNVTQGDYPKAQESLKKAIALEKKYADFHLLLARVHLRFKNPVKAYETLGLARKRPFLKKSLENEAQCILGATTVYAIEKEIASKSELTAKTNASHKKKLLQARERLVHCEEKNPQGFDYHEERARLAVMLSQM
jgi:tetratricopeptide (TPR) repeat protein